MARREYDLLPPEQNGYPTPQSKRKKIFKIVLVVLAILFIIGRQFMMIKQSTQEIITEVSEWFDFEDDWD